MARAFGCIYVLAVNTVKSQLSACKSSLSDILYSTDYIAHLSTRISNNRAPSHSVDRYLYVIAVDCSNYVKRSIGGKLRRMLDCGTYGYQAQYMASTSRKPFCGMQYMNTRCTTFRKTSFRTAGSQPFFVPTSWFAMGCRNGLPPSYWSRFVGQGRTIRSSCCC